MPTARFSRFPLLRPTLLALALAAATPALHAQKSQPSVAPTEPVTLNFANADIDAVARTMATITGRNVVVDPRIKGQMTLVTERPVTPAVAFQQFLSTLRLQGFTVVESAGLYKVVPEADAKLQAGSVGVSVGGTGAPAGGQIVTQIFQLQLENAANLVPLLRPLISPNNTINVNPGNNALIITDYADNLQRLARIIAALDVANATDVEIIALQHALASELAPLVAHLLEGGDRSAGASALPGQQGGAYKTTVLAEPRSNALIVRAANATRLAQVRALVARLDQPATSAGAAAASGNIHVVYLKNADAVQLATTLRAALSGSGGGGAGGASGSTSLAPTGGSGGAMGSGLTGTSAGGLGANAGQRSTGAGANAGTQVSTGGFIQADPTTNSLVITAPEPLYRQIRAVIDQLDGRRAQVLIESLIVEVNANKVAEFGIQWQGLQLNRGNAVGLLGTSSGVGGSNILDLALAAAGGKTADTLAALPRAGLGGLLGKRVGGNLYLGALANFLENSGDANVLSTPNLMTLDNQEAQIIIGDNVPFVTGSYANTGGNGGAVNPFTTVERKDVGLMLRVRPTINENGSVKLTLYQEVSKIAADTLANANGPSTRKRAIESTVLVDDGSIIVIGGLLEDSYALGEDKVPVMGDIPVVGNLFRNEKRTRQKTNLMVFLRPTVIRDNATSDALVLDRYEAIRALQQDTQPEPRAMLRAVPDAPVLPPLPAAAQGGPAVPVPAPLGPVLRVPAPAPAALPETLPDTPAPAPAEAPH